MVYEFCCIYYSVVFIFFFFFQAEDGIRDVAVTGVQTCALPISHHRFMLAQLMDDLRHAEAKMERVEEEIKRHTFPFGDDVARLWTIPGIDRVTAWGLVAELGLNMDQFPSAGHAASWAGLCPGNFESAGKRLSG